MLLVFVDQCEHVGVCPNPPPPSYGPALVGCNNVRARERSRRDLSSLRFSPKSQILDEIKKTVSKKLKPEKEALNLYRQCYTAP